MKNSNILKLILFIFMYQFSIAQKVETVSSVSRPTAMKLSKNQLTDVPIAKYMDGNMAFSIPKKALQTAVQEAVNGFNPNITVEDIKIVKSNIDTYYLGIVAGNNSMEKATIFLPLGSTGNSPDYFFVPGPGHVVTCINIIGCPNDCSIVKYGPQNELTGCNCGGFNPGGSPSNGNTSTVGCNFKVNKYILEKELCMAIKIKIAAFLE
ncbi:hypothetical protein HHL23_17690 [Chryseobacterium sp. RP-3-3]|uniref:Uncharacterized protein n=1 Tax=Chryseobacterium antibioticum TaxID=2728847 RepID=A0A7Y0AQN4_9FLAO|nr:hypothetical protein [Chryseobacterium antibioticum]NML71615.1 hypothetical protein [Chryseobacterium antibioticum]